MSGVEIHSVKSRRDLKGFIKLPWKIYKDDPAWIPPLIMERKDVLSDKNPFFEHAERELYLADMDGEVVGRISAHIDHLHNQIHSEKTGLFGFFEVIDDPSVGNALLDQASCWLREKGMKVVRGPFSFSINEEAGLLVDGFDHPPFIMTGHNPPYYPKILEGYGMVKVKDLYCWKYDSTHPVGEAPMQIAEEVRRHPGLKIREVDPKNIEADVKTIIDVFNSAWGKNWGFVPLTERETQKAAKDFKMILEPKLALIAEVDGKPAAIALALPNLNDAIRDLNGHLFPFGIFKLIYRIKRKKIRSARLMLLGVKPEYRGSILGGLSVLFYTEMHRRSQILNHWGGELSWTLEDNERINVGIEFMGGRRYKTYRIYQKSL